MHVGKLECWNYQLQLVSFLIFLTPSSPLFASGFCVSIVLNVSHVAQERIASIWNLPGTKSSLQKSWSREPQLNPYVFLDANHQAPGYSDDVPASKLTSAWSIASQLQTNLTCLSLTFVAYSYSHCTSLDYLGNQQEELQVVTLEFVGRLTCKCHWHSLCLASEWCQSPQSVDSPISHVICSVKKRDLWLLNYIGSAKWSRISFHIKIKWYCGSAHTEKSLSNFTSKVGALHP